MKWSPLLVCILSVACDAGRQSPGATPNAPASANDRADSPPSSPRTAHTEESTQTRAATPSAPNAPNAPTCDTRFSTLDPPQEMCPVWGTDVDAALKEARSTSKPTLVFFCSQWTAPCKPMRQETLENNDVLQELTQRYQLVYVNATDVDNVSKTALLQRFAVTTLPQLVVLDPEGNVTLRLKDYSTRDAILKKLRTGEPTPPTPASK